MAASGQARTSGERREESGQGTVLLSPHQAKTNVGRLRAHLLLKDDREHLKDPIPLRSSLPQRRRNPTRSSVASIDVTVLLQPTSDELCGWETRIQKEKRIG